MARNPFSEFDDERLNAQGMSLFGSSAASSFEQLARQRNVVLTTSTRDGDGVPTTVHIVVDGDVAYVRIWAASGEAKRMWANPEVLVAPSTGRGKPLGPAIAARARRLGSEDERRPSELLRRKYPLVQGLLVPLAHRIRHHETAHYELTFPEGEEPAA